MQIRNQIYCFVLFLAILLTSSLLRSEVGGAKAVVQGLRSEQMASDPHVFYAAVSQHFQVPPGQVQALVGQGVPPGQVVVVYFLAEHSLRQPAAIARDRAVGKSWREIAMASGLQPEAFYYPLPSNNHKPFVNVFAIYHDLPRTLWTWDHVRLTDDDIENLVNLRFLSDLGVRSTPDVVRMRSQGLDFVRIHHFLLEGQKTADREHPTPPQAPVRS